ncbi:HAD hydrolase family protein [Bacillus halotolerans]|uniref:HAD hydrolase family protein n=1 Tax=Bacillus halotolerans TaxID=260554 RepID=UPI00351C6A27
MKAGASKGNAVRQLSQLLRIEQEEVMCIGDKGNDLTMIEWAGCGVAMANAIPEVREIANFET